MEEFAREWADIRDDSELCQLLSESDLLNVDVHMEDIDQSGNSSNGRHFAADQSDCSIF